MLNIKKNISINASPEKVWNFLLSLRYSMLMNRSHIKIDFPLNLDDSFKIHQNLAIVKYISAKILTVIAAISSEISPAFDISLSFSVKYDPNLCNASLNLSALGVGDTFGSSPYNLSGSPGDIIIRFGMGFIPTFPAIKSKILFMSRICKCSN